MPIDLSGIQNVGEFYSHHYLDAKMTADGGNTRWERRGWRKYTQEQNQSAGDWQTSKLPSTPSCISLIRGHLAQKEHNPCP